YKVLAGYILVSQDSMAKKTAGGIFIPETAVSVKQNKGMVVLAGEPGEKEQKQIYEGFTVIFPRGVGIPVTIDKKEYLLMRQRDVLLFAPPENAENVSRGK
ncbi:MAG: co-chaperone GroES family protein, partial [Candidatus Helarchaeota archaeon]